MSILKSCVRYTIALTILSPLILSVDPLIDSNNGLTYSVFAQLSDRADLRSPDTASNPADLIESIGSPGNLMDSILDEVRNSNTSGRSIDHDDPDSYSQGESIILSHQIIPAKDFIHLYDTTPFAIAEGSISTKLPCDSNNNTPLKIMIGQIPKLQPVNLSMETDLSRPGYMCLYYFEIQQNSTSEGKAPAITDIVLFNTSGERTVLPNTSTFVIGITKLYPLQNTTTAGG